MYSACIPTSHSEYIEIHQNTSRIHKKAHNAYVFHMWCEVKCEMPLWHPPTHTYPSGDRGFQHESIIESRVSNGDFKSKVLTWVLESQVIWVDLRSSWPRVKEIARRLIWAKSHSGWISSMQMIQFNETDTGLKRVSVARAIKGCARPRVAPAPNRSAAAAPQLALIT